jgi:hypothetical protein
LLIRPDSFITFYQLALELVEHLRAMAETNALFQRSPVSLSNLMMTEISYF